MSVRVVTALVLTTLFLPSALARAENPKLEASVGANDLFTISLRDASGSPVKHLDPGTYDIAVHDLSELHDFHLKGPGVDMASPVPTTAELTWMVTFSDGTYTFVCDPHATTMKGSFTVGNVPAAPTKLNGAVGPKKTISVRTAGGVKAKSVPAGKVVLTVDDRSRIDNFHLKGAEVNRATGVRFRGRVTWNLTLTPGSYTYRSDRHARLRGSFTVVPAA